METNSQTDPTDNIHCKIAEIIKIFYANAVGGNLHQLQSSSSSVPQNVEVNFVLLVLETTLARIHKYCFWKIKDVPLLPRQFEYPQTVIMAKIQLHAKILNTPQMFE